MLLNEPCGPWFYLLIGRYKVQVRAASVSYLLKAITTVVPVLPLVTLQTCKYFLKYGLIFLMDNVIADKMQNSNMTKWFWWSYNASITIKIWSQDARWRMWKSLKSFIWRDSGWKSGSILIVRTVDKYFLKTKRKKTTTMKNRLWSISISIHLRSELLN